MKEKKYTIKVNEIEYDIEEEDIMDEDDFPEDDSEDYDEYIERKVQEIQSHLPQELDFEVVCTLDDLDEVVVDTISDITGWMILYCDYDVTKVEEVEVENTEI